ncbi:uncharacterized protein LOC141854363 [Brevipalpus obovatus]|uniref:uncharacterized protein LOC141854363 n=1 Tax=Brevipalpus obovatus TaxID=246614 RepID=UPI003D9F65EB
MFRYLAFLTICVFIVHGLPHRSVRQAPPTSASDNVAATSVPKSGSTSGSTTSAKEDARTGPTINWGKCPQLEPSNEEKVKKAAVITKCLEMTPIPKNITRETVEAHREQVAACALQMEGWFDKQGLYRFDKAEGEIKAKKLGNEIEGKVLAYHNQCKSEAEEKYPISSNQLIAQIQLYQACMDYFISEVCGIEVSLPEQK